MDPFELVKLCETLSLSEKEPLLLLKGEAKQVGTSDVSRSLVGKVLSTKKVNEEAFIEKMEQIWSPFGKVEIEVVGDNIFVFYFNNPDVRDMFWARSPWHFNNSLIVLEKPHGFGDISSFHFNKVEMWVQIHCLPLMCRNKEAAKNIAEKIGLVVEIPAESKECRGRFLQVKVQIDISNPLKRFIRLGIDEEEKVIIAPLTYERLPEFCYACGKIGHDLRECTDDMARIEALEGTSTKFGAWMRAGKGGKSPSGSGDVKSGSINGRSLKVVGGGKTSHNPKQISDRVDNGDSVANNLGKVGEKPAIEEGVVEPALVVSPILNLGESSMEVPQHREEKAGQTGKSRPNSAMEEVVAYPEISAAVIPHNKKKKMTLNIGHEASKVWKRICPETTTELNLLADNWKYLLAGLGCQYIHGLAAQGVHYIHRPGPTLQDLGFIVLPELGQDKAYISETLFSLIFLSFVLWTLKSKRIYTVLLWCRVLAFLVVSQFLRIITFFSTQLPAPNYHCREGSKLARLPPPQSILEVLLINFPRGVIYGCGDLIFSSHMIFTLVFVLTYQKYGTRRFIKEFAWMLAVIQSFLIVASHKHYTVDVVVAWYTVNLVVFFVDKKLPVLPDRTNGNSSNFLPLSMKENDSRTKDENHKLMNGNSVDPADRNSPILMPSGTDAV